MTPAQRWQRDGYLLMPGVFDSARIARLREATEHAFAQWRASSIEANQPGGFAWGPSAWVMLHVNHARYYARRRELLTTILDAVADPVAVELASEMFGEPAMFMQANLYIDPPEVAYAGGGHWHRDCQFFSGGDKQVEQRLMEEEAHPPRELHLHIPLVPTEATGVVPGTHRRWDTAEEAQARAADPRGAMPGGIRLPMAPGDLGLFHVNSIHRGYYEVGTPRHTIAITYGAASRGRPFDPQRWRDGKAYIATYQPWMRDADYLTGVQPATRAFFERFIDAYQDQWTADRLDAAIIGAERVAYFQAR
jgi:ectoine hydroxylase-related dioxygenase (phytanoyl-CoA dioxygenase family)